MTQEFVLLIAIFVSYWDIIGKMPDFDEKSTLLKNIWMSVSNEESMIWVSILLSIHSTFRSQVGFISYQYHRGSKQKEGQVRKTTVI